MANENQNIIGAGQDTARRAPKDVRILVACEESQAVCIEFRKLGFSAFSCDIQPCSGGHPEWHIQTDVTTIINSQKWDVLIAFPPCTYLSSAQLGWYNVDKYGDKARRRVVDREVAVAFFLTLFNAPCNWVAVENPVGIMSTRLRKPDQIVQPWMFGDEAQKTTCLWLKNLPHLVPTKIVSKGAMIQNKRKDGRTENRPIWFKQGEAWSLTPDERRKLRSKTFRGLARAMAEQWGAHILCEKSPAQDTIEICHTAPNSGRDAMPQQVEMEL